MNGVINLLGGVEGEFNRNDTTYSFLSRERYQIDLKFCHLSDLEFLAAFKGNNDFGALLGHLLTSLHLKWSDSGMLNNTVFLHTTKAANLFFEKCKKQNSNSFFGSNGVIFQV